MAPNDQSRQSTRSKRNPEDRSRWIDPNGILIASSVLGRKIPTKSFPPPRGSKGWESRGKVRSILGRTGPLEREGLVQTQAEHKGKEEWTRKASRVRLSKESGWKRGIQFSRWNARNK
eukprot:scaffold1758_cov333-Pavlova_lutheri.AAC.11